MSVPGLEDMARAAGFDLSEMEIALLRGLENTGKFDGVEYEKTTKKRELSEERYKLPSIWTEEEIESFPTDTFKPLVIEIDSSGGEGDTESAAPRSDEESSRSVYLNHQEIFDQSLLPIVSGSLLAWFLDLTATHTLSEISIRRIKIEGTCSVTQCSVKNRFELSECVFQTNLQLSGRFDYLYLHAVLAESLVIKGECREGIILNDVQVRSVEGVVLLSAIPHAGLSFSVKTTKLEVYGLYSHGDFDLSECEISHILIRPRLIVRNLVLNKCECDQVDVYGGGRPEQSRLPMLVEHSTVNRDLYLRDMHRVDMQDVLVRGDLKVEGIGSLGQEDPPDGAQAGIHLTNVDIKGSFILTLAEHGDGISLIYDRVTIHRYLDRVDDLRKLKELQIQGLEYWEVARWPDNENQRMVWLALQPDEPFPLKSWQNLAAVQRREGRYREARRLLVEGERRRRAVLHLGSGSRFWSWILRTTIGYGWELWRLGWLAVVLVVVGAVVGYAGEAAGVLAETSSRSKHVEFDMVVYSLDSALPVINMGHASLWIPNGQGWIGKAIQVYFWCHVIFGWLLTTLLVIGFTGIARKRDNG